MALTYLKRPIKKEKLEELDETLQRLRLIQILVVQGVTSIMLQEIYMM